MEVAPLNTGLETLSTAIALSKGILKEDAEILVSAYFKSLKALLKTSKESFKIPFSIGVLYTRKDILYLSKTQTKNYNHVNIYNVV